MKQKTFYTSFMALMVPTAIVLALLQCNLLESPPLWAIPFFLIAFLIGKSKIENLAEKFSFKEMGRIVIFATITAAMITFLGLSKFFSFIPILICYQIWGWICKKWDEKHAANLRLFLLIFLLPTIIILATMGEPDYMRIPIIIFGAYGIFIQTKTLKNISAGFILIILVSSMPLIGYFVIEDDIWGIVLSALTFITGLTIGWLYEELEDAKEKDNIVKKMVFLQFIVMCSLILIGVWFDLNLIKWYLIIGSMLGGIIAYLLKRVDLPSWDKTKELNPLVNIDDHISEALRKCGLLFAFLIVPAVAIMLLHISWVESLSGTDIIGGIVITICGILISKSFGGNKLTTKGAAFAILATVGILYVKTTWNSYNWDSWLVGISLLLLTGGIIKWCWLKVDRVCFSDVVRLIIITSIGTLIGFFIGWFVSWLFLLLTSSSSAPGETGFTMIMIIIGATFAGCGTSITRR